MYARVLELKAKRGQARALATAVEKEVKPIVEKYTGFVEGICMIPDEPADSVLTISFWEDEKASENFRSEGYPKIAPIFERFTEPSGIRLRNCDVTLVPTFQARAAKASGGAR